MRDQHPLGVHAVQDIAKPPARLADHGVGRDFQVVDEDLAGVVVDHRVEFAQLDAVADGFTQIDEEGRDPVRAAFHLVRRLGAGQQQHEVGLDVRGWSRPSGR